MKELAQQLRKNQSKLKNLELAAAEQKIIVEGLRLDMINAMTEVGTVSYKGTGIGISLRETVEPVAEDWDKIWKYIKKNDAGDLLQRRLASGAWKDRMEDRKDPIPGIGKYTRKTLYVTLKGE